MRCLRRVDRYTSEIDEPMNTMLQADRVVRGAPYPRSRFFLRGTITLAVMVAANPGYASDVDHECCAALEERIAELEATTAHRRNRNVSLSVSGDASHSILFWDDGGERNAYIVGHNLDQSHFAFAGDAIISPGLTTGLNLTLRLRDTLSSEVNQLDDDAEFGFVIWEANWHLQSKGAGRLTVGQASRVTDTAPENDLSKTIIASYAGVQDLMGGFFLRSRDATLTDIVWGDIFDHLNGNTANVVRYDTPTLAGFIFSANYGEDDLWDVGAKYEGEGHGFEVAATIAYSQSSDQNGINGECCEPDNSVIVGSAAVLHQPSGLNALIAAGQQTFDQGVQDADGSFRTPADPKYLYTKLGWITNWSSLGPTAFYGEYGHFRNFTTAGLDGDAVASLAAPGICATPGNCRVTSSAGQVWGFGVLQTIEAAQLQLYVGYRHHSAAFDLVDRTGSSRAAEQIDDFHTIVFGSFVEF